MDVIYILNGVVSANHLARALFTFCMHEVALTEVSNDTYLNLINVRRLVEFLLFTQACDDT